MSKKIWAEAHRVAGDIFPRIMSGFHKQPGLAATLANFACDAVAELEAERDALREALGIVCRSYRVYIGLGDKIPQGLREAENVYHQITKQWPRNDKKGGEG